MEYEFIKDNIDGVKNNINTAFGNRKSDRPCTLICVSKTKPKEAVMEAYNLGERDFGENKVQELTDKYEALPKDIRWHLIGHLQTNKVKYIVDKVYLIHSVDSVKLASKINDEAGKKNVKVNILVQVNVADEDSKFGMTVAETIDNIKEISTFENITVKGLMTIAPYTDDAETNREYFSTLYNLARDIEALSLNNVYMNELSMGMSGDYMVAVEEGATYVRVGTGIFGERDYSKKN